MAIRLGSTVINCADLELMTSFWSQALHLVSSAADDDDDFRVLRGEGVYLPRATSSAYAPRPTL